MLPLSFVFPGLRCGALGLCLVGLAQGAMSQTQAPGSLRTLDLPAVLQAARSNLEVSLAQRLQEAAQSDLRAADRAPTPVLSARASSIALDHGMGGGNLLTRKPIEKNLGLDWTLERGDKRALRTAAARSTLDAAGLDVQEARLRQQVAAAASFYELLAVQDKLAQLDELARAGSELAALSQRRLQAGDISQQELLRTEIEVQRTLTDRRAALAERERAITGLSQLTGLAGPLQARADWPQEMPVMAPPALALRPDVQAAQRRVEAARAALDNALALRRNDVTVGTGLSHQPGTSRALVELRLQMPLAGLLGNYAFEGEIGRAQAQLDQAGDELERTRRQAASELALLGEELRAGAARLQSYEADIVPRARRVAQMSELAYGRGALALVDVIDARRTLRSVLLEQIAARADHARALASWQLRTAAQP